MQWNGKRLRKQTLWGVARLLVLALWRGVMFMIERRQLLYHTLGIEGTMSKTDRRPGKYVGHLTEGALRFRNELAVGREAPDFELRSLDGDLVRLSDYRGKSNVVLILGSFTCGPPPRSRSCALGTLRSVHCIDDFGARGSNSFLSIASRCIPANMFHVRSRSSSG